MSQSPDVASDEATENQLVKYRDGWSALSQLIGKGHSFSGHERNCCFLNLGNGRFADVSSATGLDLIDDGRAVALADWNFDGAVDLWLANRTAPRVRFLQNEIDNDNHWLSVRLRGVTCNRDAIGARVELFPALGTKQPLIKTLHAGDGYLSQSSKWVHFGLGDRDKVDRIVVRWPGGKAETFRNLKVDSQFILIEGSQNATAFIPPKSSRRLAAKSISLPPVESNSRTWIQGRLPIPESHYQAMDGEQHSIDEFRGQPLLINLWSGSCLPCIHELRDWTDNGDAFNKSGLRILALCVDAFGNEKSAALFRARRILDEIQFPFASGLPTKRLIDHLEAVQRTVLELQKSLPVPCSFLLDEWGRIAAIYKGSVATNQIISDVGLLSKSKVESRMAAVPFVGRFASQPFPTDPLGLVRTLDLAGSRKSGTDYLIRYVNLIAENRDQVGFGDQIDNQSLSHLLPTLIGRLLDDQQMDQADDLLEKLLTILPNDGPLHRQIAMALLQRAKAQRSMRHFEAALKSASQDAVLLHDMAIAEMSIGRVDDAIVHFQGALELGGDDAATHFHLGNAFQMKDQTASSIRHFQKAMELQPNWSLPANNLAWILSTNQDANIRDGEEAVRLAERVCKADRFQNPTTLSTLAVAYAEAKRFDDAVKINRKALTFARQRGMSDLVKRLTERIDLFRKQQPVREGL